MVRFWFAYTRDGTRPGPGWPTQRHLRIRRWIGYEDRRRVEKLRPHDLRQLLADEGDDTE